MQIRIGLPIPGGALLRTAQQLDAPVLVSASAFVRRWPAAERWQLPFPGFKAPVPELAGADVALDSAGFVAMVLHRGFPWSVAQYVELAASHPWSWWSQMDLCCEAQVAGDRDTVKLRTAETARLYAECAREAQHRDIKPPMPIVQGWRADDYAWSADWLPADATLIGVGSVCRRQLGGPDGVEAVVARLDRVLPPAMQLHLFGVKSQAVELLAGHPRIASVDSMAWDSHSRRVNRGHNTMAHRSAAMRSWYERQVARATHHGSRTLQPMLDLPSGAEHLIPEDLLQLIAEGEIELSTVSHHFIEAWLADDD